MANVKNGDTKDFEHLIRMHQQRIFAYAYSLFRHRQEAEDLVQEVFLQAFRKLPDYEPRVSFSAWLYKIAYNQYLNILRKRNGWLKILHLVQPAPAGSFSIENEVFEMTEYLCKLSDLEKQIVLLRVLEDKSFDELAVILDGNAASLRKKFERAKNKIKKQWTEEEIDGIRQPVRF
ncbi:hypothetical protein SD71_19035 [Cohnella kolymensis]|uniref:RNA polymerase sigma factor n=1 Tax=Cohnella kolymensis TaxID=1590652 RepID=A0ABR5A0N0_9BACL|nr:hypothetical protein SD71_19035 [Cohnella kolymensis]